MDMDRERALDEAKGRIEEYLQKKGINTRGAFTCLNPEHTDRSPSMRLDKKRNRVHCFSCGASYDIFDLVAMDENIKGKREIFDKTYQLLGIQVHSYSEEDARRIDEGWKKHTSGGSGMSGQKQDKSGRPTEAEEQDYSAYYEACKKRIAETDYTRGLSPDTINHFNFGYDPSWRHPKVVAEGKNPPATPRLIVPTSATSYLARDTRREIPEPQRGYKKSKVGRVHIFNPEALLDSSKPTFIVEGEIDAASIYDVGGSALALGSTSYLRLFLDELDKLSEEHGKPKQPIIIALDNDTAGSECAEKLSAELEKRGIISYRLNPCGEYKDANDALVGDRESFAEAIRSAEKIQDQAEEEREAYLATSAGTYLQQFIDGIAESVNTECIPTGFKALDEVLDGGMYEGLYTIGAISSLGKTSLIQQIADKVAEAGHDVLIFSLEMARAELMSKSISRHTLQIALEKGIDTRNAKTARGITDGKRHINYNKQEAQLIRDAITDYSKYAERLYIQEGIGDIGVKQIRETIEKHIHFTGRRPLVVVDYMQILAPYNERATDKQNTDKAILELKRMSRDYKLPLIAISAFNRNSYRAEAMFEALKESGSIEYTSDVVIGLQLEGAGQRDFDPTTEKKRNPRQVELVILKNRQGKVGDKIRFEYYPQFNFFVEKGLSD